jgi:hypothetical protein
MNAFLMEFSLSAFSVGRKENVAGIFPDEKREYRALILHIPSVISGTARNLAGTTCMR